MMTILMAYMHESVQNPQERQKYMDELTVRGYTKVYRCMHTLQAFVHLLDVDWHNDFREQFEAKHCEQVEYLIATIVARN